MSDNFHIGQDIVCVKTHSQGFVKEGQLYVVKGLSTGICRCNPVIIDVGIVTDPAPIQCGRCKIIATKIGNPNIFWFGESLFRPLDELCDISELTNELKKPIEELFKIEKL